jgi:serine/threonine protein kinase/Tol biopolymer transport system component
MPLAAGTRLGPYEIVAALGAGGMGEVYRARDARLGRDVAVKVLPAAVATDSDRRARFEREARAVAALSHPNILSIFEFAFDSSTPYAVTELLEGETLREVLAASAPQGAGAGALPVRKAVDIATQISRGLAAAHDKGIVHRDLKPENVFLTRDGHVKILDFGLAKAFADPRGPDADTTLGTDPGTVVGTVGYMAPEQIRGQAVDGRTDLFALGAVLYEMLAGRRAFARDTPAETMTAILKEDPPELSASRGDLPAGLDAVVRHCLERNPNERFQSARDLAFNLQASSTASGSGPASTATAIATRRARVPPREAIAWILAGAFALASAAAFVMWRGAPSSSTTQAPVRFQVPPPLGKSWFAPLGSPQGSNGGTISPDGRTLAFVSPNADGKALLWVRPIDNFAATALAGTEGAAFPFWSPDSHSLAFFTQTRLLRIAAAGGPVQPVTELSSTPRGGSWSQRGVILFATAGSPVMRVPAGGGQPSAATKSDAKNPGHQWPSFLPDGERFLYYASGTGEVCLGSLGSTAGKTLLRSNTNALFAPPGDLLFIREGTLFVQRLDMDRFEPAGEPVPLVPNVSWAVSPWNHGAFSVSWNGVLTFRQGGGNTTQFAWFDRAGRRIATVGPPGDYVSPSLSPDETRVAFTRRDGQSSSDIWTMDLDRQTMSRFTFGEGSKVYPVWSPDGRTITYESTRDGLFTRNVDGTGAPAHLLGTPAGLIPEQLVPERNLLLFFADFGTGTGFDVYVLPLAPNAAPSPVIQSSAIDVEAQLSPDGRWIAYSSTESDGYNVFVQPYPTTGAKYQISTAGGRQPLWRRDGKELFYVTNDAKFYAVDVRAGTTFEFSPPQFLFNIPANTISVRNSYVPSRNGQRFFINELLDKAVPPINVDLDWRAGAKR